MWLYQGKGFLVGVPARDLTDEEMKQFPGAKESGLYVHIRDKKPKQEKPVIIEDDNEE